MALTVTIHPETLMSRQTHVRSRVWRDNGYAARRRRMAEIVRQLGLSGSLDRSFPAAARDQVLRLHSPSPVLVLADQLIGDAEAERVRRELEGVLRKATFRCPRLGDAFPVADYFAYVKPLAVLLVGLAGRAGPAARSAFTAAGRPVADEVGSLDTGAYACEAACNAMGFRLLRHNRIDRAVYWVSFEGGRTPHRRWQLTFRLNRQPARAEEVEVDGVRRRAYRCGVPTREGMRWAAWDPPALGLGWPPGAYPVCVQRHALDALYGRNGRLGCFDGCEWVLHEWLVRSLAAPTVRPDPAAPGRCLVDFAVGGVRLGYLVAERVGGVVLVRTFLFLTMDGTPEAAALRRTLRLGRADRRYLGLDDVRTFLRTDLATDPELVRAFTACGCGPLFTWAADGAFRDKTAGQAEAVRRYLGIGGPAVTEL